jgi:HPt (histidine-containing phosphotransfer) domain-containing protein
VNKNNRLIQLDYDLLDNYLQSLGADVIAKMLALYREQVVVYLMGIETALLKNNDNLWQVHCHKMKGAAGSIGLKSLHAQLALMEQTSANISEKAQQLAELNVHNTQALMSFDNWLKQYKVN